MDAPIIIRSFRAVEEPETCEQFYDGHVEVLRSYGVNPISSAKREWFINPAVYGVIAEQGDRILGGVKIHKVGGTQWLPVEEGVGYLDERLFDVVKKYAQKGAGEACGLWNSRDVSGFGLSLILMQSIVSICNQVNVSTLFGLSSDHTLALFESLGYRIIKTLGNKGDFVYPTPDYLARVIKMNPITMTGALPYNKETVFALREQPNQTRIVKSKKGEMEITFRLHLPVNKPVPVG